MTSRTGPRTQEEHLAWWKGKLDRMENRTFELTTWGPHILDRLLDSPGNTVTASRLSDLARILGVPLKFAPRAIASVTRLGIVSAGLKGPEFFVSIHPERFSRHKQGLHPNRQQRSEAERRRLMEQCEYRCAECGDIFPYRGLHLDHLIRLVLLGADHPANLVPMCRGHNSKKRDQYVRDQITRYRMELVQHRIGVRFIDGAFWPVINGRIRRQP